MKRLVSWVEIPVADINRAVNFYNSILGISLKVEQSEENEMAVFPGGEGTLLKKKGFNPTDEGVIVNLDVGKNLDKVMELITEKGGRITRSKTKIKPSEDRY